ncbi:hypothetical protein LIER_21112 [Lithospermum erythrorhizon]|uniref:Uncharacterized protein n=1 Tax=Lithospermum erythrorhizon TaxID=34254 RepID=A0AAV3QS10_LITER
MMGLFLTYSQSFCYRRKRVKQLSWRKRMPGVARISRVGGLDEGCGSIRVAVFDLCLLDPCQRFVVELRNDKAGAKFFRIRTPVNVTKPIRRMVKLVAGDSICAGYLGYERLPHIYLKGVTHGKSMCMTCGLGPNRAVLGRICA